MGVFDWIQRPPERCFGFQQDPPDARDRTHHDLGLSSDSPPALVSLRHPAVLARSQSPNQSCVGFFLAQGIELGYAYRGIMTGDLSARAPYFWARARGGKLPLDDGCNPRDALASVRKFGIPSEISCPTVARLINQAPSWQAYQDGRDRGRGLSLYARIDPMDLDAIRRTVAAGIPVGGGWACDRAFVDYKGGGVLESAAGQILGYHAMLITGYYADGTWDLFNQSWLDWGDPGSYARVSGGFICSALDLWGLAVC